ncbi:hypothetical protein [Pseudalkalibacillus caeni]|uniref:hypothetical protein n=1 Tax=Exobacillus caeni TaxID=2574798 RepID=UPI001FED0817|nr:hypothetical protein [Pseudalkalibacillus caeni]
MAPILMVNVIDSLEKPNSSKEREETVMRIPIVIKTVTHMTGIERNMAEVILFGSFNCLHPFSSKLS